MKFLPLLFLTLLPIPVQAITWKEFWEPFRYERPYYRNYRVCTERVYYEEYVPGNRWRPGYVRTWSELVTVPCDSY